MYLTVTILIMLTTSVILSMYSQVLVIVLKRSEKWHSELIVVIATFKSFCFFMITNFFSFKWVRSFMIEFHMNF